LNKVIADSGYCARRKADALIESGQVAVNGETVRTLGLRIRPGRDKVTVQGKPLPAPEKVYILLHKPAGYVTSRRAGKDQKTVYALLPEEWRAVDPAGRLDQDSSGLLLLSSDGDFIHQITHPRFHLPKVYEVKLSHQLVPEAIARLQEGIMLQPEGKLARMQQVKHLGKTSYRLTLVTGYNRQIRRTLETLGNRVLALKRVSFGTLKLGDFPVGQSRPLYPAEIQALLSPSSKLPLPPK
jgi:23S rRNA pseudouridine2605 synthase